MLKITTATPADIPALVALLNSAYRGEESKKGWTTEADLLAGDIRTDEATIAQQIADPHSDMLKCEDETGQILGCVYLKKNDDRLYLGMLSVQPGQQGRGIGKMFLRKAEEYAGEVGCAKIYMQVITARTELNEWYLRHGYAPTGERFPFNVDIRYGKPTQELEFMVLEKTLAQSR